MAAWRRDQHPDEFAEMASSSASSSPSLGFLTVVQHTEHGYFGGLLALGPFGRPLEFHCTLPVRPSRAQEVLYGPTLRTYLCGEQIAAALLGKLTSSPVAILTDDVDVLSVAPLTDTPVLLVPSADDEQARQRSGTNWLNVGDWTLATASITTDVDALARLLADFTPNIDPAEPFERIRSAIDQAQRSAA
jgi:hypothetical protein